MLHGVSLEVPPGPVTTLLGPNGAGKSTMVLAVGGVLRPSAGEVSLGGTRLTSCDPSRSAGAGVAIVPEGRRLLPELTVEDNLRVATYSLSREDAKSGHRSTRSSCSRSSRRAGRRSRARSPAASSRWSCSRRRSSRGPSSSSSTSSRSGSRPVVVKRLIPALEDAAAEGVGVLLIEQFVHVALELAESAYVIEGGRIL